MMTEAECISLERLLKHAQRDNGQSRRVADFLLTWWNEGSCGGFDIATAWGCDTDIVEDIVTVFEYAARHSIYPNTLGYKKQFKAIVEIQRSELTEQKA